MTEQQQMSVWYGSVPINGTDPIPCNIMAFEAWDDTIISSVKDVNGVEYIQKIKWDNETVDATKIIFFGFPVREITLQQGRGQGYNADSIF